MGRAYDFVVAGTLMMISVIIHLISVELFKPESALHAVASDGTATLDGAAKADMWFQILSVWMPLGVFGAAMVWVLIREYRRQIQTATARPARP